MYIRSTPRTDKKTGKKYVSYQLVESVRTDRGPRQNVLLTLDKDIGVKPEEHKILILRLNEIIGKLDTLTRVPERIDVAALHLAKLLWQKGAPQLSNSKQKAHRAVAGIDMS